MKARSVDYNFRIFPLTHEIMLMDCAMVAMVRKRVGQNYLECCRVDSTRELQPNLINFTLSLSLSFSLYGNHDAAQMIEVV